MEETKQPSEIFKISQNWNCIKSLDELIADAKFIFTNGLYKGRRPRIVLFTPIDGFNCIEIDYDKDGLITNGVSVFDDNWGKRISDSSAEIVKFIKTFLIREKADGFIKERMNNV